MIPGYTKEAFVKRSGYTYKRTRPQGVTLRTRPTMAEHAAAIRYAEHMDSPVDKQMIRTRVRPKWDSARGKWGDYSTAFGWAQITRSTARGFMNDPYMRKKYGKLWEEHLNPMYEGFNNWTKTWHSTGRPIPTDSVWGFGGHGNFSRDQWSAYDDFAKDIMRMKIKERNRFKDIRGQNLTPDQYVQKHVNYWSGPQKSDYMEKYYDHLYRTSPELFSDYVAPKLKFRPAENMISKSDNPEIRRMWDEAFQRQSQIKYDAWKKRDRARKGTI